MSRAARTLAILSLAMSVSCSGQLMPATPPTAETVVLRIYGTDTTAPLIAQLTSAYLDAHPLIQFESGTVNHAVLIQQVLQGERLYFASSHRPADADLWAAPIAQDGLALIVSRDMPLANLSLDQIRRIYRGHIRSWQELGGADLGITIFSRENGSDTRLEFERLVMGRERTSPNAQVLSSSAAMIDSIASTPGAIGYVPFSQISQRVQVLAIDGAIPSRESIQENRYPLRSMIYVIGQAEPLDDMRAFIGWIQGPEGQANPGISVPLPR